MNELSGSEPVTVPPSVLVVDDVPANLDLLCSVLRRRGYRVRPAISGELALLAATADPPDLVLLDVSMPEMDGFEVARRLKSDSSLKDIPIIFLTALTEVSEKVRAFSLGGVDYVTKPFNVEEIEARVATQVELARQRREIRESYERLNRLEGMRDSLVHMIVHDLRAPLTTIQMSLEYMTLHADALPAAFVEDVDASLSATISIGAMLTTMLEMSRLEGAELKLDLEPCDLVEITKRVVEDSCRLSRDQNVVLEASASSGTLVADPRLLTRVVQNLLGNAIRFGPPGETIHVDVRHEDDLIHFEISDRGPGIPQEFRSDVFSKFLKLPNRRPDSTGLGLAFCRLAVEAHHGSIRVSDGPDGVGSTFSFTVPRNQDSLRAQGLAVANRREQTSTMSE